MSAPAYIGDIDGVPAYASRQAAAACPNLALLADAARALDYIPTRREYPARCEAAGGIPLLVRETADYDGEMVILVALNASRMRKH